MLLRNYIKGVIHAVARLILPRPPPPEADVAPGDIVVCGSIVGKVQAIVRNECGTIDAVILIRDREGQLTTTTLPADGRYDIELDVIAPADAVSRGILFSRWRMATA